LILGFIRAVVSVSIIFFAVYLVNVEYLNRSIDSSLSSTFIKQAAPVSYGSILSVYKRVSPGSDKKSDK